MEKFIEMTEKSLEWLLKMMSLIKNTFPARNVIEMALKLL